jgi:hypothetical protein
MQIEVEIECCPELEGQTVYLGIALGDALGRNLFGFGTREFGQSTVLQGGRVRFGAELEKLLLMPGRYGVNLYLGDSRGDLEVIEQSVFFDVVWAPVEGVVRPPVTGVYFHPVSWTISSAE